MDITDYLLIFLVYCKELSGSDSILSLLFYLSTHPETPYFISDVQIPPIN